jgi:hypothetical protein
VTKSEKEGSTVELGGEYTVVKWKQRRIIRGAEERK